MHKGNPVVPLHLLQEGSLMKDIFGVRLLHSGLSLEFSHEKLICRSVL